MLFQADPSDDTWARRGYFGLFWFFVAVAAVAIAATLLD